MSLAQQLTQHLALCDQLYALTVEENHWLKNKRTPPDAAQREKKQALLEQWTQSLAQIKARPTDPHEHGGDDLEKARQRCLQILHLDRENEQLLLRCSLSPAGTPTTATPPASPLTAAKAYESVSR